MFRPLTLYIGLKYTRARKRNHFISLISWISIVGIGLGIMALTTALSLMNGMAYEFQHKLLAFTPQVTVSSPLGRITHWQALEKNLINNPDVSAIAAYIETPALLMSADSSPNYTFLRGITPASFSRVFNFKQKLLQGRLDTLAPNRFNIVIGNTLAEKLGVTLGDKITLLLTKTQLTPLGTTPIFKRLTVSGIFSLGNETIDGSIAFINQRDAAVLLAMPHSVSGLQLKLHDVLHAPALAKHLNQQLFPRYQASSWEDQNRSFLNALQMQKNVAWIILYLIIIVATFNMLSSLVMMVSDKQSDVAILRTLGASTRTIMGTFMTQGLTVGILGILLGLMLGVPLAYYLTPIANFIQHLLGIQFFSADVYWFDFVPSKLELMDVITVTLSALCLSFLATLYPAFQAANIQPAEALRYE